MRRWVVGLLAGLSLVASPTAARAGEAPVIVDLENERATVHGSDRQPGGQAQDPSSPGGDAAPVGSVDPYEYQLVLNCAQGLQEADSAGGARNDCGYAMQACQFADPPSDLPQMILQRRVRDAGGTWERVRLVCGPDEAPPGTAVPAIPTLAQIQEAFRSLPFGKPSVSVQPVGGVTLVNLPTYYAVSWSEDGLVPGEVSEPVQLLTWSVEFRVAARDYEFDFGDGTTSGRTTDAGGVYPDGGVRHSYATVTDSAAVRVDSWLSGEYRVNGGVWQAIDTVADLQDEPVTALEVRSATNRLEAAPR